MTFDGRTFPTRAVELLDPDVLDDVLGRSAAVAVGRTVEVPAGELDAISPGLADTVDAYCQAARVLWDGHTGRLSKTHAGVSDRVEMLERVLPANSCLVEVPLGAHRQVDRKVAGQDQRKDLTDVLDAVMLIPELDMLLGMLESAPDWERVASLSVEKGALLERDGSTSWFTVDLQRGLWPLPLFGPACPGEVFRRLRFEINHASWRDRKARRLVGLQGTAFELWPDPASWQPPTGRVAAGSVRHAG